MTTGQLTQTMEALELANQVRIRNAELKREIAALTYAEGCAKVCEILTDPTGPVAAVKVGQLLQCVRGIGEDGMARFLRHAGIFSTTKRVGKLTARQRHALIFVLTDRSLVYPYWQEAA